MDSSGRLIAVVSATASFEHLGDERDERENREELIQHMMDSSVDFDWPGRGGLSDSVESR
jgi:hypothetical protein